MSMGHNNPPDFVSFDEVVRENLARGILLTFKDAVIQLSRDPRVDFRHVRIFAEIVAAMKNSSASAYPGYKRLAQLCGYTEGGVRKTISELIGWGYLVSARRKPPEGTHAMAHYTITKPSVEELNSALEKYIQGIRAAPKRRKPIFWGDDVTSGTHMTDVTSKSNVTLGGSKAVGGDVTSTSNMTKRDVTYVDSTVTNNNIPSKITTTECVSTRGNNAHQKVDNWNFLNPYNDEAAKECWWNRRDKLEVAGELKREMLDQLNGDERALRLILDKMGQFVETRFKGSDLRKRLNGLFAKEMEYRRKVALSEQQRRKSQDGIGRG